MRDVGKRGQGREKKFRVHARGSARLPKGENLAAETWTRKLSSVYLEYLELGLRLKEEKKPAEEILNEFLAKALGSKVTCRDLVRFDLFLPIGSIVKYHKPSSRLLAEAQAGDLHSIDQYCELNRIWLRSFSPGARGSPVKTNPAHTMLIYLGLYAGIENLNEEEMASLFDRFCWYCKESHSGDALVKARRRLLRKIAGHTGKCAYCGQKYLTVDVPDVDDNQAWAALAPEHAAKCEWVLTRAHRLPLLAPSGTSANARRTASSAT